MYSKELEAIIDAALADGVLTDKEREVLHRRAAQEGVDADELDVVIEGRLAKIKQEKDWLRPTPPTTEKRGNVVKCPSCGAPAQAGAVKCAECGYVFTNVKANSSMERFQKGIAEIREKYDERISKASGKPKKEDSSWSEKDDVRSDKRKAIKNYIQHFPVPSSKEDLIEFTTAMDGNRKNSFSDYEDAYRAKYKECILKIKTLFPDDPQMMELVKITDTKLDRLSSSQKIIAGLACLFIVLLLWAGISSLFSKSGSNDMNTDELKELSTETKEHSRYVELKPQIDQQYDEICQIVDELPAPTKANYDKCAFEIKKINWKQLSSRTSDGDESFFYEQEVKRSASAKVNGYIESLHSINMEYIDPWGRQTDRSSNNWYEKTGVNKIVQHTKNSKYVESVYF